MAGTLSNIINLIGNMGWRYTAYRVRHEFVKRTGLLKNRFPVDPGYRQYVSLATWRQQPVKFFFESRNDVHVPRSRQPQLEESYKNIRSGKILLFNSLLAGLGPDYDWVTNPDSGHKYDVTKHWTQISDYSKEAGDIKFVWEKSRFSYLHDVIRYDHHFNADSAGFVFAEILSWIRANPVNCGPNYRCSQEMSLRVMNWMFALYYYSDAPALTDEVFGLIQQVIYWHIHHIYNNISFSRIAVRNNHAITETLMLYLAGLFFPSMPGADKWKSQGRKWFEQEIAYQVYEDGTYLQFSMNYHRVVVQLMTWAIVLSEKNGERFEEVVYDRARRSVQFLRTCMVGENGCLPNYGGNDGALFFKLNNAHYRDYRPQLHALASVLGMDIGVGDMAEDTLWYGISAKATETWMPADGASSFVNGGYYIFREPETLTFIRCGSYKDRPAQADNLHLDIWYKGENILLDAGSYKYNTDSETIRYFNGTRAHNTVMIEDNDQMLKGGHFIWYYWTQCLSASVSSSGGHFIFDGSIAAFGHVGKGIVHRRKVIKAKGIPQWEIMDELSGLSDGKVVSQLWHVPVKTTLQLKFHAGDGNGKEIPIAERQGYASSLYGAKEVTTEYYFSTEDHVIDTLIEVSAS